MNRIVKVYVVDTDKNVPLAARIVYSTDEFFTDESDEALKIGMGLNLDKHNELREDCQDAKGKSLKPVRIDDLIVKIHTVVSFS